MGERVRKTERTTIYRARLQRWLVEGIVALGAVLFLLPILFLFVTAFKPDAEIIKFQSIVPHHTTLSNFRQILSNPEEIPVFRWFANSVFISSTATLLVLTVDSLAAYALARLSL